MATLGSADPDFSRTNLVMASKRGSRRQHPEVDPASPVERRRTGQMSKQVAKAQTAPPDRRAA